MDTAELEVTIGIRKFGKAWVLAVNGADKTSGPLGFVLAQAKAFLCVEAEKLKAAQ